MADVPRYERIAVIMKNLANAITAQHHCLQWCTIGTAFARLNIITADGPRYEKTAVIMENLANAITAQHHCLKWETRGTEKF